jgi:DNA-directed RNA polymerase subunit RPC12/RpoP
MGNKVPFRCPKCGSEKFVQKAGAKPEDDLTCARCARPFTQEDISREALKVGEKMLGDALSKVPGFKRR